MLRQTNKLSANTRTMITNLYFFNFFFLLFTLFTAGSLPHVYAPPESFRPFHSRPTVRYFIISYNAKRAVTFRARFFCEITRNHTCARVWDLKKNNKKTWLYKHRWGEGAAVVGENSGRLGFRWKFNRRAYATIKNDYDRSSVDRVLKCRNFRDFHQYTGHL